MIGAFYPTQHETAPEKPRSSRNAASKPSDSTTVTSSIQLPYRFGADSPADAERKRKLKQAKKERKEEEKRKKAEKRERQREERRNRRERNFIHKPPYVSPSVDAARDHRSYVNARFAPSPVPSRISELVFKSESDSRPGSTSSLVGSGGHNNGVRQGGGSESPRRLRKRQKEVQSVDLDNKGRQKRLVADSVAGTHLQTHVSQSVRLPVTWESEMKWFDRAGHGGSVGGNVNPSTRIDSRNDDETELEDHSLDAPTWARYNQHTLAHRQHEQEEPAQSQQLSRSSSSRPSIRPIGSEIIRGNDPIRSQHYKTSNPSKPARHAIVLEPLYSSNDTEQHANMEMKQQTVAINRPVIDVRTERDTPNMPSQSPPARFNFTVTSPSPEPDFIPNKNPSIASTSTSVATDTAISEIARPYDPNYRPWTAERIALEIEKLEQEAESRGYNLGVGTASSSPQSMYRPSPEEWTEEEIIEDMEIEILEALAERRRDDPWFPEPMVSTSMPIAQSTPTPMPTSPVPDEVGLRNPSGMMTPLLDALSCLDFNVTLMGDDFRTLFPSLHRYAIEKQVQSREILRVLEDMKMKQVLSMHHDDVKAKEKMREEVIDEVMGEIIEIYAIWNIWGPAETSTNVTREVDESGNDALEQ